MKDHFYNPSQILIIGYGSIAKKHILICKDLWPDTKFLVVRRSKNNYTDKENNIVFITLNNILEYSPDFAIIASPAPSHVNYFLHLTSLDIPIFIEKPLDIDGFNRSSLLTIYNYEKKNTVLIGYVLRHHSCIKWLKNNDLSSYVGNIIEVDFYSGSWLPSWRSSHYKNSVSANKGLGGGVLLELSHEIDLGFWLFGDLNYKNSFVSNSGLLNIEVEDFVYLLTSSADIPFISFRLNFNTNNSRRIISIRGDKGDIFCDLIKNTITINNSVMDFSSKSSGRNEMFYKQQSHFISCINNIEKPICNVRDALKVLDLIQQVRKLSDSNN